MVVAAHSIVIFHPNQYIVVATSRATWQPLSMDNRIQVEINQIKSNQIAHAHAEKWAWYITRGAGAGCSDGVVVTRSKVCNLKVLRGESPN